MPSRRGGARSARLLDQDARRARPCRRKSHRAKRWAGCSHRAAAQQLTVSLPSGLLTSIEPPIRSRSTDGQEPASRSQAVMPDWLIHELVALAYSDRMLNDALGKTQTQRAARAPMVDWPRKPVRRDHRLDQRAAERRLCIRGARLRARAARPRGSPRSSGPRPHRISPTVDRRNASRRPQRQTLCRRPDGRCAAHLHRVGRRSQSLDAVGADHKRHRSSPSHRAAGGTVASGNASCVECSSATAS